MSHLSCPLLVTTKPLTRKRKEMTHHEDDTTIALVMETLIESQA
ncbi:MAG: hypothetical protein U9R29_07740 [Thermodesulfobacteriota bacterium]|nr:hypothetical protein [Thermodesulfobacteriota bacterium]